MAMVSGQKQARPLSERLLRVAVQMFHGQVDGQADKHGSHPAVCLSTPVFQQHGGDDPLIPGPEPCSPTGATGAICYRCDLGGSPGEEDQGF